MLLSCYFALHGNSKMPDDVVNADWSVTFTPEPSRHLSGGPWLWQQPVTPSVWKKTKAGSLHFVQDAFPFKHMSVCYSYFSLKETTPSVSLWTVSSNECGQWCTFSGVVGELGRVPHQGAGKQMLSVKSRAYNWKPHSGLLDLITHMEFPFSHSGLCTARSRCLTGLLSFSTVVYPTCSINRKSVVTNRGYEELFCQ